MVWDISTELQGVNGSTGRPPRKATKKAGKSVAKVVNGKGVGKTPMSAGVGSKTSSEHSASGKAVGRMKTKGSKNAVASLAAKKNPVVKGSNSANRAKVAGPKSSKQGSVGGKGGGRGASRGR